MENRPRHRAYLEILRPSSTEILCISPQILGEFYAVVTRPSLLANPLTPQETVSRIDRLLQMQHIELLSMSEEVFKLATISSQAIVEKHDLLTNHLLREAALMIERCATNVPKEFLLELAGIQRELLAWQKAFTVEQARNILSLCVVRP